MQYGDLLSDAAAAATRLVPLAVIPLVASLARWDDVTAVADRSRFNVSFSISLPHPLADLWTFVDTPTPGRGGVPVDTPLAVPGDLTAIALLVTAVYLLATGLLMAGYLGSIDQFIRQGRYDFLRNVLTYGVEFVVLQVVVFAVTIVLWSGFLADPWLGLVGLVLGFLCWVLFYLVPFLVVVEDRPLVDAFPRSLELVTTRTEPVVFLFLYAGLVLVGSVPFSVITNADLPGLLAAAVLASVAGLFLTVLSVRFVRELVTADEAQADSPADTATPADAAPD